MEKARHKIKSWIDILKKYKYSALILLFGIILMCVPFGNVKENASKESEQHIEKVIAQDLQKDLENILMEMEGVGKASVLITYDMSQEQVYQQDMRKTVSGDVEEIEYETVRVSRNGNDEPLVIRSKYPMCRGVLVVCQGADRATVRLAVIRAVSDLTGLNSDRISVIKMKGR